MIELVIIIVTLSLVAVIAIPRLISLTSAAKTSALESFGATLSSASRLTYHQAVIEDKDNLDSSIDPEVSGIKIHYGFPIAHAAGIGTSVHGIGSDFFELSSHIESIDNEVIVYGFASDDPQDKCVVVYKTNGKNPPTIRTPDETDCS
ncbi:hypothetical protein VHP8226_03003 [Vibrio hippocampi]|uniref:MSHA biogenesis protein MshA n=1 Tax=Vibrio hippocampi TaxID=654686 RepID=A0ABN8DJI8_9VIBR|nr:hypothetical protein VHP8226_03003 [Vibrio hippocampi]